MHWSQSQPQQQLHFLSTFYMPGSTPTPCIHLLSSAKTQYNSCALALSRCSVNAQGMNGCMWHTSCWILLHNRWGRCYNFSHSAGEEDYQQSAQSHTARKQWQGWDPHRVCRTPEPSFLFFITAVCRLLNGCGSESPSLGGGPRSHQS